MSGRGGHSTADERRESLRQGADLPARFRIASGETGRKTKEIAGMVKNLSESGFCLGTDLTVIEDLHVLASSSGISQNRLEMRITLPDGSTLELEGTACWYNLSAAGASHRYEVGVRIEGLSGENARTLRAFLSRDRKRRWIRRLLGSSWLARLFGDSS